MDKMPSERQRLDLLRTESISPFRRIYRCPEWEAYQIYEYLPRFGPLYRKDPSLGRMIDEEKAWQHVLKKTPEREAITKQIYVSAVRQLEGKATDRYAEGAMDELTTFDFRWMMIKDGCLCLQMALFILGRSKQLGYRPEDEFFGRKHNVKEMKEWIKSMFLVGNQIPFVVLQELMKQSFFRQVISEGKWNDFSSNLLKRVLYEFLVLPALEAKRGKTFSKGLHWMKEQPIDLIHAPQLLVLGPEINNNTTEEEYESEDDDIEDPNESTSEDKICPSATELKQQGMHFEVCFSPMEACIYYMKLPIKACRYWKIVKGMGTRGITFVNGLSAALFLPQLKVDDETELLLRCLINYEISQPVDRKKRDFSSYLRFMSELIRTPEDANLLYSKGIIYGSRRYRDKLPRIFGKLASTEKYNNTFRVLTLQISVYNRPTWKNLEYYIIFITFLTVIQTVYAVLAFHSGKRSPVA